MSWFSVKVKSFQNDCIPLYSASQSVKINFQDVCKKFSSILNLPSSDMIFPPL